MPYGVEFDEWRAPKEVRVPSGLVGWLIRRSGGLIKNELQAAIVALVIIFINIGVAIIIFAVYL